MCVCVYGHTMFHSECVIADAAAAAAAAASMAAARDARDVCACA